MALKMATELKATWKRPLPQYTILGHRRETDVPDRPNHISRQIQKGGNEIQLPQQASIPYTSASTVSSTNPLLIQRFARSICSIFF